MSLWILGHMLSLRLSCCPGVGGISLTEQRGTKLTFASRFKKMHQSRLYVGTATFQSSHQHGRTFSGSHPRASFPVTRSPACRAVGPSGFDEESGGTTGCSILQPWLCFNALTLGIHQRHVYDECSHARSPREVLPMSAFISVHSSCMSCRASIVNPCLHHCGRRCSGNGFGLRRTGRPGLGGLGAVSGVRLHVSLCIAGALPRYVWLSRASGEEEAGLPPPRRRAPSVRWPRWPYWPWAALPLWVPLSAGRGRNALRRRLSKAGSCR